MKNISNFMLKYGDGSDLDHHLANAKYSPWPDVSPFITDDDRKFKYAGRANEIKQETRSARHDKLTDEQFNSLVKSPVQAVNTTLINNPHLSSEQLHKVIDSMTHVGYVNYGADNMDHTHLDRIFHKTHMDFDRGQIVEHPKTSRKTLLAAANDKNRGIADEAKRRLASGNYARYDE